MVDFAKNKDSMLNGSITHLGELGFRTQKAYLWSPKLFATMDIQATKSELIKLIMGIESEQLLKKVRNYLKQEVRKEPNGAPPSVVSEPEPDWMVLAKLPMPDSIDLDELAKEQGYDGKRLSEHLKTFDHSLFEEQTLEELLNSLTK
jgi:hypothetical protein